MNLLSLLSYGRITKFVKIISDDQLNMSEMLRWVDKNIWNTFKASNYKFHALQHGVHLNSTLYHNVLWTIFLYNYLMHDEITYIQHVLIGLCNLICDHHAVHSYKNKGDAIVCTHLKLFNLKFYLHHKNFITFY